MRSGSTGSGIARRAGWGVADQVISSGTNFAVNVVVLRTLGVEAFGAFSLGFFVYLFAISVARAYPMEPLAIRYPMRSEADWRTGAAAALGIAGAAGLALGVASIVTGIVLGGVLGAALVGLGVGLPGLVVQDALRMTFFSRGRARLAFWNDLVWAVALVPAFSIAIIAGGGVLWITATWGLAASVAALVGLRQLRLVPRPSAARAWWREHLDLGPRFLAEAAFRTSLAQLALVGVGAIAGIATIGYIRGAQLLMAPIQMVFFGLNPLLVPEGVRTVVHGVRALGRLAIAVSAGQIALAIAWSVTVIAALAVVGPLVLGEGWAAFQSFVPAAAAIQIGTVAIAGPQMILRALGDARRSLRATVGTSIVGLVLPVALAVHGAVAAAWGLAVAAVIGAVIWWLMSRFAIRSWQATDGRRAHAPTQTTPTPPEPSGTASTK